MKDASLPPANETAEGIATPGVLNHVADALRGLRYGQVTIIVHDNEVVQVERTERRRLRPTRPPGRSPA